MKNKLLLLSLLLFAGIANAQLIFTDPWLKNYLLASTATNNIAINASNQSIKIDVNSNGQIEQSEADAVMKIWIEHPNVTNLGGIEGFSNLTDLNVKLTPLTSVTLVPMPTLQKLQFLQCASLTSVDISAMNGLTQISCSENPLMASINLDGCTSLTDVIIRNTGLTSLDVSGNTSIVNLYLDNNAITSIDVSGCTAMNGINLENNPLVSIDVSGLTNLAALLLTDNLQLTSISAAGCSSMSTLAFTGDSALTDINLTDCSSLSGIAVTGLNNLTNLNLSGCSSMLAITASCASLNTINITGCTAMESFNMVSSQVASLDFAGCPNLKYVTAYGNPLTAINFGDSPNLQQLFLQNNLLTSLDVSGRTQLTQLVLDGNPLEYLNASGCTALTEIGFPDVGLGSWVDVDFSGCTSFIGVHLISEGLTHVNFEGCTALQYVVVGGSSGNHAPMTSLDMSNLPALTDVLCYYTDIAAVNFDNSPLLRRLALYQCNMPAVDLSIWPTLENVTLSDANLQTVDVSELPLLNHLDLNNNPNLKQVFAKNGAHETSLQFQSCPQLEFVCQDDDFIAQTILAVTSSGLSNVTVNSYCSFTPGGDYNTITGTVLFDGDNNGCGSGDTPRPDIKITINDGNQAGSTFTTENGGYKFFTGAGSFDLTAAFENQSFFAISPATATTAFADANNNVATQDFCLTAVGIHPDVEIAIAPIVPARPGFVALYQIVIKNKGNQTLSGSYTLAFEDDVLEFSSATEMPDSQTTGLLGWNYAGLAPFENRAIYVLMNVNAPTQSPPVNSGDILTFTATVNPIAGDENPADNQMIYNQVVVNSLDPNDITCIEGGLVPTSEIGEYLHYVANFENLGTAEAENVVVRIEVDADKYDINSLQLLNTSHPTYTRVTGNVVEFIFEGINLAAAQGNPPVGGHGNVLFKIKSDDSLAQNDFVDKSAKIYFDYNLPIETNNAHTVFQTLSTPGFEDQTISVFPNPAKNIVNIQSRSNITSVSLFDVQGRILQTSPENATATTIDISSRPTGIYFLKVTSDKGIKVMKLVRE